MASSATHAASTDPDGFVLTVNNRATLTTVTCSPSTVVLNQASTCDAQVDDNAAGTRVEPLGDGHLQRLASLLGHLQLDDVHADTGHLRPGQLALHRERHLHPDLQPGHAHGQRELRRSLTARREHRSGRVRAHGQQPRDT